jgi:hypothetical protein
MHPAVFAVKSVRRKGSDVLVKAFENVWIMFGHLREEVS